MWEGRLFLHSCRRSNRTFMELKFARRFSALIASVARSNRTFMELKFTVKQESIISLVF